MSLAWKLGARVPAHDYKIFKTAFVEGAHPVDGHTRRFSLVECGDWVNIIALTRDDQVVLVEQFRFGTRQVCLEIPVAWSIPARRRSPQPSASSKVKDLYWLQWNMRLS